MPDIEPRLTTGQVAARLGCAEWQVARLFERGLLPEPGRLGRVRSIPEGQLGEIRDALVRANYLRGPAQERGP